LYFNIPCLKSCSLQEFWQMQWRDWLWCDSATSTISKSNDIRTPLCSRWTIRATNTLELGDVHTLVVKFNRPLYSLWHGKHIIYKIQNHETNLQHFSYPLLYMFEDHMDIASHRPWWWNLIMWFQFEILLSTVQFQRLWVRPFVGHILVSAHFPFWPDLPQWVWVSHGFELEDPDPYPLTQWISHTHVKH